MRLNLGCGPVQPDRWVNVDGSNRAWLSSRLAWLDRLFVICRLISPTEFTKQTFYANLLKKFPWQDGSIEAIYMGEFLEHLTLQQGTHLLRESYRVLKPGGILRVRVPDHVRFWKGYLEAYDTAKQPGRAHWSLDHTRWTRMFFDDLCTKRPHLWQSMGHYHKWMYDEISLILLFESVGFQKVERMAFLQSAVPDIGEVEVRDDLIVEGIRP